VIPFGPLLSMTKDNSKVIAQLEQAGAVKMAGAFYGLKTGPVEFFA